MRLLVPFRDAPIRSKLMLIGLLTTALALFSVSIILVARDWVDWRDRTVSEMNIYAALIGANAAPSMIFGDYDAAQEVLRTLGENPNIVDAVLYDINGNVFARYRAPEHPYGVFPFVEPGSYLLSFSQLVVSKPVVFKGEPWGTVYLESDLRGLYADIKRHTLLTLITAAGVFMVTLFLFSRLQRAIVDPVTTLSGVMRNVSVEQDYAVRVPVQGKDEVGVLAGAFNTMLERIQMRDVELARYRSHLEDEVVQRTASLQESEARYRSIFEYADDIIYLLEPDGRFRSLSPSFERVTGWRVEEWIGKPFEPIIHPDDLPYASDIFRKTLGGESVSSFRLRIAKKSGEYFDADLSITPLGRDAATGALGIARDVTERKQVEEKIHRLNEELEIKVQERTRQLLEAQEALVRKEKLAVLGQVAGSVGHELRNPLGVMSNAVYFLQTVLSDADDSVKDYLNIIKSEIAGSERIVSDLLDSVRTKPPRVETIGVRELIEQTLRKLSIPASVTVKLDLPDTLSPMHVDPQQIHQVFRNLISNGVEAMPEGGVLDIRAVENRPEGTLTVSVRDSGIGMTPEQMGKLFQPLFTTKARGIGLGLVVVKNLTQANGGTVNVESEADKGTVFAITLPVADETGVLL